MKEIEYGPVGRWPIIDEYRAMSESAYSLEDECIDAETFRMTPLSDLIRRTLYVAKSTSFSIGLLNSWCLFLQALALLRVRIEQAIVDSYLLHEDVEIGLKPFVTHIPVQSYLRTEECLADPDLSRSFLRHFTTVRHLARADAVKAQSELPSGFDPSSPQFQRRWTKLNLEAMCKKRDDLVAKCDDKKWRLKNRLEILYRTVYKDVSSIVHADCASMSSEYLHVYSRGPNQPGVLLGDSGWAVYIAQICAFLDILQISETLEVLGFDVSDQCRVLHERWRSTRARFADVSARHGPDLEP